MIKTASVILVIALASLILIGSSGTFVSFNAPREVKVSVVPHEKEYLGFDCEEGYAAVIQVGINSTLNFNALTLRNYLTGERTVMVKLIPDYSSLPENITMNLETEDGVEVPIVSQGEYTFWGNVSVGNTEPGEYEIPVTMSTYWNDGDAVLAACPIKLIVVGGPTIQKELISGDLVVPAHTYEEWTFRITVTSPSVARNLTIRDVVKGEYGIKNITETEGNHTVIQQGASNHVFWDVKLEAGESAHMDITVYTKLNKHGKQEFTSCGLYQLNDGAEIIGYGIRSNSLTVTAKCGCENDCRVKVKNYLISGPTPLPPNHPGDYNTRLVVKNMGNEKNVTIRQYIGKHFTLTNYAPTSGTVTVANKPDGRTLVTWTVHLNSGETEKLDLYEHTEGVDIHHRRYVLLVSKPCVMGCGWRGGFAKYIQIKTCGCRSKEGEDQTLIDGMEEIPLWLGEDNDTGVCEE